ncbi:hypothetical protein NS228_12035 [Methylobacterium indicum]|uniref:hypothetical protein n=1 Tax=Methylobacterium indicum TaxID=1775910 RepID=UPI0007346C16|nr:hypothetical protein [Methylobacterium indicum]KTS29302.1 hypothetical protein NS229_16910 [Methylobacterium indicum]KTS40242.1 hypothetical protein NS228_12035 [Methylobacterium indicum]KTS45599.1 hypothetical protein NS230_23515 [Methylobacterium indicum]
MTEAVKGLRRFGTDGLVFALAILGTFGALSVGAPPAWTVAAGSGFCLLWLLRNYVDARIALRIKMAELEIEARCGGQRVIEKSRKS